jgi:ferredoxin
VIGDFYVEDGCCTSCGIPEHFAPDLFEPGSSGEQCYVKKQPTTPDELSRMLEVFRTQEVGCIRYRGEDPVLLQSIERIGEGSQCDHQMSWFQRVVALFRRRR